MDNRQSPLRPPWRHPRLILRALLAAAPVLAITLYLYMESRNSERLLVQAETARQADNAALQFHGFIDTHVEALKSVGNFALGSPTVVNEGYMRFVERLIADTPGFEAIGWIDAGSRLAHVQPDERARLALDPAGAIAGEVVRKALASQRPAGSDSFEVRPGQQAITLILPIYRDIALEGFVAGVLRLKDGRGEVYDSNARDYWNLCIVDHAGRVAYRSADADSSPPPEWLVEDRHMAVADRSWKLRLWPTPMLMATLRTGATQRILVIGLVAAAVLATANFLLGQRQERLSASLHESTQLAADVEQAQRHLHDLVNGIEAVVWESDPKMRRFTFVNDYGRKLLGFSESQWIAEPDFWYRNVHPDDRERALENSRHAHQPGHTYPVEYRMVAADGRTLWVREIITVIGGGKRRTVGKRGVIVDITARVQAEEALRQSQKLESLGVLAGGIAHDFNNLLTTILGNAEMLGRQLAGSNASASACNYLGKIERTTRRLAELTRQMLAYSGRGKFAVVALDLNAIIAEMTDLLEVSTPKNVRVSYQLDAALPPLEGDTAQMRQVILNLLTNATEAIGEARGEVVVRTEPCELDAAAIDQLFHNQDLEPGRYVRLEVSDTGCGMDAETLSKIFDPFFTTKFTGRGLGLAALRGIVRGHRGGIRIFSQMGEGTVFSLVFPVTNHLPHLSAPRIKRLDHMLDAVEDKHTKALLVDDEDGLRTLMGEALKDQGFDVLQAADGEEGVEQFRRHADEIDVVVLDLTMPKLNGDEAFEQMIALRPDACVILCSGYTKEEVNLQFEGRKVAGFIEKPFTPSELITKIQTTLAMRRAAGNDHGNGKKSNGHVAERQLALSGENTARKQPPDDSSV
jgi:PAS domain S-box-containing protein